MKSDNRRWVMRKFGSLPN